MTSAALQSQLHELEQQVQSTLRPLIPELAAVQINYAIAPSVLTIAVYHRPETTFNGVKIVNQLKCMLTQALPQLNLSGADVTPTTPSNGLPRLVYLHVYRVGEGSPYWLHQLPFLNGHLTEDSSTAPPAPAADRADEPAGALAIAPSSQEAIPPQPITGGRDARAFPSNRPGLDVAPHRLPTLVLSVAAGLFVMTGFAVALTRPCVIGRCQPLEVGQTVTDTAIRTIQSTTSGDDILDAYDHLLEVSYALRKIPFWSGHHAEAQALLSQIEAETDTLQRVVEALKMGSDAAQKSQNPPHPMPRWREIQTLWRDAIALLQDIPSGADVYPLVTRKLTEYEANLTTINQRLMIEHNAQANVNQARATAQQAETREGLAKSVTEWNQAYTLWQTAVGYLQQVPTTTMAYAEAQQLLDIYRTQLAEVGDRQTKETIATDAYQQAIQFADQAQAAEAQNQWTQAVDLWRNALTYAEQIPTGTSYAPQAQTLTGSYRTSLANAQENLRIAIAVQQARIELDRACTGSPPLCTYAQSGSTLQVRFAPSYDQAVARAMVFLQPDPSTNYNIFSRANYALQTISMIGTQVQLPIELYAANGDKIGTYDPELAGYVR